MTTLDFCRLMGASNGRKAMVLAIQQYVPGGPQIIADEHQAFMAHKAASSPQTRQRFSQCRQRRKEAEQVIRERFELRQAVR
jgi:hypothetical protein